MATYTTNYNLEKPAQTDIYNVDVFNANADKIDAGLTDKAEKTMLAPVETTNSASRSYAKGEYFVYNNVLCCATTAIAAGGTIAIGTNCATAPVGGELTALRESLTNINTITCPVGTLESHCGYVEAGNIVAVEAVISLTSAVSSGGVLLSGLPKQYANGTPVFAWNQTAASAVTLAMNNQGQLTTRSNLTSGNSLRMNFCYRSGGL